MRKEIVSPAKRTVIPESPTVRFDNSCVFSDGNIVDKLGNTYSCSTEPFFWTDGFSSSQIGIGKSLINPSNCSFSFWSNIKNNASRTIIVFGSKSENGLWIETQENILIVKNNSGVLFSNEFTESFTVGITKSNAILRFYLNGVFQGEIERSIYTENNTAISVSSEDRMNNFIAYEKTLTDSQMNDLHLLLIQGSSGVDRWGYITSKQTFSMEI